MSGQVFILQSVWSHHCRLSPCGSGAWGVSSVAVGTPVTQATFSSVHQTWMQLQATLCHHQQSLALSPLTYPLVIHIGYHNLVEVLITQRAISLHPQHSYNFTVDFLLTASITCSWLLRPEREAMETYINDALAAGIIWPSSSPTIGTSCFIVPKRDGSLYPCLDYLGLNNIPTKTKYSLPLLISPFKSIHGATVFAILDIIWSEYERERWMKDNLQHLSPSLGQFENLVMPFVWPMVPGSGRQRP